MKSKVAKNDKIPWKPGKYAKPKKNVAHICVLSHDIVAPNSFIPAGTDSIPASYRSLKSFEYCGYCHSCGK